LFANKLRYNEAKHTILALTKEYGTPGITKLQNLGPNKICLNPSWCGIRNQQVVAEAALPTALDRF
jgi:hypothetical protein